MRHLILPYVHLFLSSPAYDPGLSQHLVDANHVVLPARCQTVLLNVAAVILLLERVVLCACPAKPPDSRAMCQLVWSSPQRLRSC